MSTQIVQAANTLPAQARTLPDTISKVQGMPTLVAFSSCPSLSKALALARDRCKSAAKDSRNSYYNYDYASADGVIQTAREAMAGLELALIPVCEELTTLQGGNQTFFSLNRLLVLSHSSGESVPLEIRGWPVIPEKGRPLDKAYAAALSSSLSYKLRDLLQMPRGIEEDISARDDRQTPPLGHAAPAPAPTSQPTPAAQPVADPNHQPPASPTPATITPEQRQQLVRVIQQHQRTTEQVQQMLASVNLKVLDQLPQTLLGWATAILTSGQVSTEQLDRIAALITKRNIPGPALAERLRQKYGVERLRLLTIPQADEIEKAMVGG